MILYDDYSLLFISIYWFIDSFASFFVESCAESCAIRWLWEGNTWNMSVELGLHQQKPSNYVHWWPAQVDFKAKNDFSGPCHKFMLKRPRICQGANAWMRTCKGSQVLWEAVSVIRLDFHGHDYDKHTLTQRPIWWSIIYTLKDPAIDCVQLGLHCTSMQVMQATFS